MVVIVQNVNILMLLLQEICKKKEREKSIQTCNYYTLITRLTLFYSFARKKKSIGHFMREKNEKKLRKLRHITHEKGADAYEP